MNWTSGRIRTNLARTATIAGLSVVVLLAGAAPAFAQDNGLHKGWYKNGKAGQKSARKAERRAQKDGAVVVVDPNGRVIDRSQTQAQRRTTRNTRTYRNGGTRVYDYRNSRVDPYAQYPQYRRSNPYYGNNGYYGNNNGYYGNNSGYYGNGSPYGGNQPYYDNREGDKDREDVAEIAARNGYSAGFQRGQYDASRRDNPNPYGHGAYQFGYDGFDPEWGSASTYQQYYRQYFLQGYNDAYAQRGYNGNYRRRF